MKRIKNEFEFRVDSELINVKAVKPKFQPSMLITGISSGIEPVYSKHYIRKTNKEEIKDYEAFNRMHESDGTFTESDRNSKL